MKKFIKENWFKLGILVFFLLITSSIFYYFVLFLPHENEIEAEQVKQNLLIAEQNKIDIQKEKYRVECEALQDENRLKYQDFLNTCEKSNSIEYCLESEVGQLFESQMTPNSINICIETKQNRYTQ